MNEAREIILGRIRSRLPSKTKPAADAYAAIPRHYTRTGSLNHEAVVSLLIDRLVDYDSEVVRVTSTGVAEAIATLLAKSNETRLIVPAGLPPEWLPTGLELLRDNPPLANETIETAHAVLTGCEIAVASTGTLILRHGPAQGRRVLSLLPDHHICLVREDQIVETIPEAFARIADATTDALTTISGPSATSDIEMTRIRGVHGPRRLSVILLA